MKDIIKESVNNGATIILDTNIYLNIYEVSPELAKFECAVLNAIKPQIVVPSTVMREFKRNHRKCHGRQTKKIQQLGRRISKNIESTKAKIANQCGIIKSLDFPDIDELKSALNEKLEEMLVLIDNYADDHTILEFLNEHVIKEDPVETLINCLDTDGQILEELTTEDIYILSEKADQRYSNQIPPGCHDEKSKRGKQGIQLYGDYFIWIEILRYATQENRTIIFVTDDAKSDWWNIDKEGIKQFHSLLASEFLKLTGRQIVGISSNTFFSIIADLYNIEKTPAVAYAIEYSANEYIQWIVDEDIFSEIVGDLVDSGEQYLDMSYSGEFEFSDEINSVEFVSYEFGGYENDSAIYYLKYKVELEAFTRNYWGRDDDTKEPILSPPIMHKISGTIILEVVREVDDYLDIFDDFSYESVHIFSGDLEIISSGDVCVQCGVNIGNSFNYDGKAICSDCMVIDEYGDICTRCGRKINKYLLDGDLLCPDCAQET